MNETNAVPQAGRPDDQELARYVNLKLAALGEPLSRTTADLRFMELAGPLLRNYHQKDQLLGWPLPAVDGRIQAFLEAYLEDVCPEDVPRLPGRTFILDRPGVGRALSLPPSQDRFESPYLTSYRLEQGVLHNPRSDRRTTQGVFHVAEGGLPIPEDKQAVPKAVFARLLAAALRPPPEALVLPFTADQPEAARLFVSLLLRPLVCPATDRDPAKRMELRFFAPGSLVSNLDFVEGIFGNGGDPYLPENDAAYDVTGWSGHTGCVILAPHLVGLGKRELGLPHEADATPRQRRDGMCWREPGERYNGGKAFKVTARDARGVMVTLIADNYYGYCKKEVKTQISFAANLSGLSEEEHAGGALAYPSYVLGQEFYPRQTLDPSPHTFEDALRLLGGRAVPQEGRWARDARYQDVLYVPEDAEFHVNDGAVRWTHAGERRALTLRAGETYVLPSGYRVRLEKQTGGAVWRLVGTRPDGTLCHKPCTVSGGGKSEISKSLQPMIQRAPIFVKEHARDLERAAEIVEKDYSRAYRKPMVDPTELARAKRPFLSPQRSLGSVIKLLTPSRLYTDEYNAWVRALPQTLRQLVFVLKRYYRPEWGGRWREHFTVDRVNGWPSHVLKFDGQRLVGNYLRVGFDPDDGSWRMYKLRPDFNPADKVQVEDDITASVVVPAERVGAPAGASVKLVENCEALLFQRPDDAVHRGFDLQAEADLASPGTFCSNFEPLDRAAVQGLVDKVVEFDAYGDDMKALLLGFLARPRAAYAVSSAHARLVDGKPSKNPRYLQRRPDLVNGRDTWLAAIGERLHRGVAADRPLFTPVGAVLAGRRTNPPQPEIGLPPLAVFSPIHYQELPELFMDFLASLTGKSPSTTGFGSEGALTKAPFNALPPVFDMNAALLGFILTGYGGFTTAAGWLGPRYKVEHDLSMLVPEVWCRMSPAERDPRSLIESGFLEKLEDLTVDGRKVLASRLGWRITSHFVDHFLGRLFETPATVFTEEMLRPELQGLSEFAAGVDAIVEAQTRVARGYFDDGSVEAAIPPLRALLHVMVHGQYEGLTVEDPRFRALFTREATLSSGWYRERLAAKQRRDLALWRRHEEAVEHCPYEPGSLDLAARRAAVKAQLGRVASPGYLEELNGTLGADPLSLR